MKRGLAEGCKHSGFQVDVNALRQCWDDRSSDLDVPAYNPEPAQTVHGEQSADCKKAVWRSRVVYSTIWDRSIGSIICLDRPIAL